VKFDSIGGHKKQIRSLKEMVVFPLMYPEVFQKFNVNPPRYAFALTRDISQIKSRDALMVNCFYTV